MDGCGATKLRKHVTDANGNFLRNTKLIWHKQGFFVIVQLGNTKLLGHLLIAEALRRQKDKKTIKNLQKYTTVYFRRASTSFGEPACV
jgi:hypothetical protein